MADFFYQNERRVKHVQGCLILCPEVGTPVRVHVPSCHFPGDPGLLPVGPSDQGEMVEGHADKVVSLLG